jgi:6-phosphogluconate dehydrogenase
MKIGIIGLGKMGGNMAERLIKGGHHVVGYARTKKTVDSYIEKGIIGAYTLGELIDNLEIPRILWMMIPAGPTVDETIEAVLPLLSIGDVMVDGGNSNYKDTLRRADRVQEEMIHYVDVGVSGGVWGLEEGYSMMVGGSKKAVAQVKPILKTLAPSPNFGWGHVGKNGAGHFVKMIHNGIEYGLMQAYAEGFAIMKDKKEFELDLGQVGEIWRFGSVVRSWLLDLTTEAIKENPNMEGVAPYVADSGEGRWTVAEAIELDIAAPVITLSLMRRLLSRDKEEFSDKLLAAMRNKFGGHSIKTEEK